MGNDAHEKYEKNHVKLQLWDDCDRTSTLLHRLIAMKEADEAAFRKLGYDKIYVDEVQDY